MVAILHILQLFVVLGTAVLDVLAVVITPARVRHGTLDVAWELRFTHGPSWLACLLLAVDFTTEFFRDELLIWLVAN